ncbi:fatty acid desaturase [Parerythrobacter jejuensis]|uniref:Beta-carotene hydroxylase n=1 Tax=Parerythrobacter jejuensis TaxID=795812 RepID=A0A845ANH2_9SPHN|nr:fatty acid desaturase [Parerythrobacter jejuensis]MXP30445.1 beta-carotene hydroxylase [Parerythrobacter jejuensis]MXP33205.1 beta-carotene hydroxylase [Parerythrobacter jejuensis]
MNVHSPILPGNLAQLSSAELTRLEREIAQKYAGKTPWETVAWGVLIPLVWIGNGALALTGTIPLWLGFVISTLALMFTYAPNHDAQHHIIGRKGTKRHRLNEFVGHWTSWLLVLPFETLRVTHLDHHRHTNDPQLDSDITTQAPTAAAAIWESVLQRQPNGKRAQDYRASLERAGREDLVKLTALYKLGFFASLFTLAWNGLAIEAFVLWWLPYQLAMTYIIFFLSWAPHSPDMPQGKYRDTKSWKSKLGDPLSMWMGYHVVHHLHPYIPLLKTKPAYWEMRPILEARGVKLGM